MKMCFQRHIIHKSPLKRYRLTFQNIIVFLQLCRGTLLSSFFISKHTYWSISYCSFTPFHVTNAGEINQAMNHPLTSYSFQDEGKQKENTFVSSPPAAVINQNVCHGEQLSGRSGAVINTLMAVLVCTILVRASDWS